MRIIEDEDESFLERLIDSWIKTTLYILLTVIALAPLATAITFTIIFSPWCLFILAAYLFMGPFIIMGYLCLADMDCY